MKVILKPIVLFAVTVMTALQINAQTKPLKLGYVNVEEVLYQMPESKQVESDLKTYRGQLETQLSTKMKEYEEKYKAYEAGGAMMAASVRSMKEQELQSLQTQIQEFQKNAEMDLQKKQNDLLEPVLNKIKKAIDDVVDENSYTWIFNSDEGMGGSNIIKMPKDDNITNLVLKKLGVTPSATGTGAVTTPTKTTTTPAKK